MVKIRIYAGAIPCTIVTHATDWFTQWIERKCDRTFCHFVFIFNDEITPEIFLVKWPWNILKNNISHFHTHTPFPLWWLYIMYFRGGKKINFFVIFFLYTKRQNGTIFLNFYIEWLFSILLRLGAIHKPCVYRNFFCLLSRYT